MKNATIRGGDPAPIGSIVKPGTKGNFDLGSNQTFTTALERALHPKRAYNKPQTWKKPIVKYCRYKMKIFWHNGPATIEPSWERKATKENPQLIDEHYALERLITLCRQDWVGKFSAAYIYMSPADNPRPRDHTFDYRILDIFPDGSTQHYDFGYERRNIKGWEWVKIDWKTLKKVRKIQRF